MDPFDLPKKWTYRQFLAACQWLETEWNRPNRSDHYLIAIATETRRSYVAKPNQVKFDDLKLKFSTVSSTSNSSPILSPEQQQALAIANKAKWLGAVGMDINLANPVSLEG